MEISPNPESQLSRSQQKTEKINQDMQDPEAQSMVLQVGVRLQNGERENVEQYVAQDLHFKRFSAVRFLSGNTC